MWTSPVYKLNRPVGFDRDGNRLYEQIVIDVTKSAPSFATPGKTLECALKTAIRASDLRKGEEILDFGAGKLRNTLFLLSKGYKVCAVEFGQLFEKSYQADESLQQANRYPRFSRLVPPHRFIESKNQFGLALLINVINIMPVAVERLLVLDYCHRALRPNGCLLWYTQRGGTGCFGRRESRYRIADGVFAGINRMFKTFYREFTAAEIDSLFAGSGFDLVSAIPGGSHNQARLYRRLETAPLGAFRRPSKVGSAPIVETTAIVAPPRRKPKKANSLVGGAKGDPRSLPIGKRFATGYQRHVKHMLEILFSPQELRYFQLEVSIFGGVKRLDILASNKSRSGFFYSLKADRDIRCPTIVIECKNYRHSPMNPEFDQLGSRLGKKLGMVGLLAYRTSADSAAIIKRCQSFYNNEEKVIIPLSDEDFVALLKLKKESKKSRADGVEHFLDQRLFEIVAR